ncbi:MerR family transcriptional regulator [Mucilaginibacter sp. AW1-3]
MDTSYAVKQLAKLTGVSVRTLHLYDKIGLLTPSRRTQARYRRYGEAELLRLQQVLFYRELDFALKDIRRILDDPDFDLITALDGHRAALIKKKERLDTLLVTIEKTVSNLKNETMRNYEELYEGMPKEQATAWRNDAIEKWGELAVTRSEETLLTMPEDDLKKLKADQKDIRQQLRFRFLAGDYIENDTVQQQIARHYANICGFWGLSPNEGFNTVRYKGLAELYMTDERYMAQNGKPDPEFAAFMRKAMIYYADTALK